MPAPSNSKEFKISIEIHAFTEMFTVALLIIAKP